MSSGYKKRATITGVLYTRHELKVAAEVQPSEFPVYLCVRSPERSTEIRAGPGIEKLYKKVEQNVVVFSRSVLDQRR